MLDIDGVVADVRHRLHHLAGRPKRWSAFFAEADADPLLDVGASAARDLADSGHDIVWLTGRPDRLRSVTLDWLARHHLPAGPLHMRADGDFRPARETKLAVLVALASSRRIAVLVDDDPQVVAAVAGAGIPTRLADWVPRDADGPDAVVASVASLHVAQERDGRT